MCIPFEVFFGKVISGQQKNGIVFHMDVTVTNSLLITNDAKAIQKVICFGNQHLMICDLASMKHFSSTRCFLEKHLEVNKGI